MRLFLPSEQLCYKPKQRVWWSTQSIFFFFYLRRILGPGHGVFRAPVIRGSPVEMKLLEPVDARDRSVSQSCRTNAHISHQFLPHWTWVVLQAALTVQHSYKTIKHANLDRNVFFSFWVENMKTQGTGLTRWHTHTHTLGEHTVTMADFPFHGSGLSSCCVSSVQIEGYNQSETMSRYR